MLRIQRRDNGSVNTGCYYVEGEKLIKKWKLDERYVSGVFSVTQPEYFVWVGFHCIMLTKYIARAFGRVQNSSPRLA